MRITVRDRALVHLACWCFSRMSPLMRYYFDQMASERHAEILATASAVPPRVHRRLRAR